MSALRERTRTAGRQEAHERKAAPASAPPLAQVLRLQRTAGNTAVAAMLQRAPSEQEHTPSDSHEQRHLAADKEAELKRRAIEASQKIDAAGHVAGTALRGAGTAPTHAGGAFPSWFTDLQHKVSMSSVWGPEEEEAQQVLKEYATFWLDQRKGEVPPNLRHLFQYAGRSSMHAASAKKAGNLAVSDGMMGGGLTAEGKPTKNWCTQATTTGMIEALKAMGFAPKDLTKFLTNVVNKKTQGGVKMMVYGEAAYAEKLLPGDQVMYLFETGQYGGHTVTAIDDLDTSFTHVSGNAGDAIGVGIGESKRLKQPPKPKSGGNKWELYKANRVETAEDRKASSDYIHAHDFGGGVLTYSIVRYGAMLDDLENLPNLAPDTLEIFLDDFGLKRLRPTAPPAAVTEG